MRRSKKSRLESRLEVVVERAPQMKTQGIDDLEPLQSIPVISPRGEPTPHKIGLSVTGETLQEAIKNLRKQAVDIGVNRAVIHVASEVFYDGVRLALIKAWGYK